MVNYVIESHVTKQIKIAACLMLAHIAIGYSMGWTAPIVPKLQDVAQTPLPDPISLTQASWIGSILNIGGIFGPYISGPILNIIGRKPSILIGGCIHVIGQILLTIAVNLPMILAGRFIVGLGIIMIQVTNIVYIGEIATPTLRGIILTGTGMFHAFGTLLVYSIGPFLSYASLGYVALIIAILQILATFYIPESPMFYLLRGKEENARNILIALDRGKDIDNNLKMLAENAKEYKGTRIPWKELFTIKSNRRSLFITVALLIFQLCSGIMAVAYFLTTIFENAGSSIEPATATIIVGVIQLLSTMLVPFLIERAGRKTLLLLSTAGCFISMFVLGGYFYMDIIGHPTVPSVGWLPLACMIISFGSFGIGLNSVPNTLIGEMFRPNVRSIGSSITFTTGLSLSFVSVTTFGYLVEAMGSHFTFWIFAGTNALGFIFTLLFVPETKGMSLVEIEKMLAK